MILILTSDSKYENEIESVPKQREPSFVTSTEHVKSSKESVKKVEHRKQAANLRINNQMSRGHKTNRNNKAYFVCKSLNHLIKDCDYYEKQMVQKPVPIPTGVTQSTVKSTWPVKHVVNKAHSPVRRPFNQSTTTKNSNFHKKVTTVKVNVVQVSNGLGPQKTLSFLFDVHGNPQQALKDKGVINSGCSRHMTGNISFLLDFEEIDGGYVAFGRNPKGGKISGKGKIKTGKLDFNDTLNVLFFSSNYKLPDENHVLLRAPKENNMYNVNLNNVVPSGGLTCLFANATLDESNLWHRRESNIKPLFCGMKGIKREFSVARIPQQNEVSKRKNRKLIEATRTMLADSLLPIPFWAEVYVDDIIFGSTNKELCKAFEKLMNDKFQMSSMGEL
nr:hypothetical protein [Tanacetum cinerariifolium]